MNLEKMREQLILHEGLKLKPYTCTGGKLTIGVGRNLENKGINHDEAMFLLDQDIDECVRDCIVIAGGLQKWNQLSDARQRVLVDMRFNLGGAGLRSFRRMLAALQRSDYPMAAVEMLDSRWATQVGQRAVRLAQMMREG